METLRRVFEQYREKLTENWSRLQKWQQMSVMAVVAVIMTIIVSLIAFSGGERFAVLFSNLDPQDAALITSRLKEENIEYRLENQGRNILIPDDQVYEKRLLFAAEGLPQSGIVGYEIFDENNIGLTDFVQQLNYKRALEGELSRTINSISEIEFARVHIMIPKPSLFIEDEEPASASVLVKLVPGKRLKPDQVQGIANLIAASVEGLQAEKVTIVDSRGKVLSDQSDKNSLVELTATQFDLQRKVESYLEDKVSTLLAGIVGTNNYMVRVTSELDFNQVERTMESYDPESSTIRSQESDKVNNPDANAPGSQSENVVTNYEISKTVQRVIGSVGNIRRLSVAVIINGKYETIIADDGTEVTQYTQRSDEELEKIAAMVKNAIGFDAGRNDQVEVTSMPFDLTELQETEEMITWAERMELLKLWGQRLAFVAAALFLVYLLKAIFVRLRPEIPVEKKIEEPVLEELEVPLETQLKMHKRKIVNKLANERPNEIAKLIRTWVIELENEE